MPLDPGIYGAVGQGVRSVQDYDNLANQAQLNKLQLLTDQAKYGQMQQGIEDASALRGASRGLTGNVESDYNALLKISPKAAADYRKSAMDAQKTQSEIGLTGAQTDEKKQSTKDKAFDYYKNVLGTVQTPGQARNFVMHSYTDPTIGPELAKFGTLDDVLSKLPSDPAGFQSWKANAAIGIQKLAEMSKVNQVNQGDRTTTQLVNPATGQVQQLATAQVNQSPDNAASNARMAAEAAASRAQSDRHFNATRADAAQAVQYVTDPETGATVALPSKSAPGAPIEARPVMVNGKPLVGKGGTNAKVTDAKDVLSLLDQAEPLIDKATNSYLGQGVDEAARVIGKSTEGAQAGAQLKALEGALVSKMPKMSGPQSDKDVLLYRQMAGQIGDPSVPRDTKKAAMQTIRTLNERYAGVPAGSSKAGSPAKISSDSDYNALPSGAEFIAPDGSHRRKP